MTAVVSATFAVRRASRRYKSSRRRSTGGSTPRVGGYRIVEPIGRGGTSIVYRAEQVRLGRTAALKLLTPALGEDEFRERFLRESQLAASLDHPNIVPVFDAGEEDGLLYIAMAASRAAT